MTNTSNQNSEQTFRKDIQQTVTDTIVEQLEKGTIPWQKPWAEKLSAPFELPKNAATNSHYNGINIVLLWTSVLKNSFTTQHWASFNQWKAKNQYVRKGEKGTLVVYYDTYEKEIDNEVQKIPYLKHYYVFNKSQLEGYNPEEQFAYSEDQPVFAERIDEVDQFVEATEAIIESHDGGAIYRPKDDKILMPYFENFKDTFGCTAQEGFYSTLFHELGHWTGAKHRLDRLNHKKFGDKNYAAEELTAEFTSAFLSSGFGLATLEKGDHAAYIENWLKVLKDDKTILFTASSAASKAVDYLMKLQPVFV